MSKVGRVYWPYICLSFGALFLFGMLDNLRAPFFPDIIEDLNLKDAEAAWFFATASLMAFFGSYFAPKILHIVGSLWGMRAGLLLVGLGFGGFAFCNNLMQIIFASATFGVGLGLLQVMQHVCIQEGANENLQRRLFSGLHSMYALAALFAPILAAVFLQLQFSWRKSFLLLCVLPIGGLLQSLLTQQMPRNEPPNHQLKVSKKEIPSMLYLGLVISLYMSAELSISTRLVLYVNRIMELDLVQATYYLSLFFVGLLAGRLFFTFYNVKGLSSLRIVLISLCLSFFSYTLGLQLSPWFLSLCGLTMAPAFPAFMDLISQKFKEKAPVAMSVVLATGSVVLMSMHYVVGLLTDAYGIHQALFIGPVCLLISIAMLIVQTQK